MHKSFRVIPMVALNFQPAWTRTVLALAGALVLSGCAAALVGGAATATVVGTDRRSTGTVIDDQTIEVNVVDRVYSSDQIGNDDHIKVEVYEGVVLLVGEVRNTENRELASQLAEQVQFVKRVVNELDIATAATTGQRLDNTWLTTKVNSTLVKKNPVHGFDATRIKVVSSRNKVYLMGRVSREEGNAAAEVARNVSGVEKVVKVFSYTD